MTFNQENHVSSTEGKEPPAWQQKQLQECRALIATSESNRRERPTLNSTPLKEIVDYAQPGTVIDNALHHLNEGIPNGQKLRVSTAFRAMRSALSLQELWLRGQGYDV